MRIIDSTDPIPVDHPIFLIVGQPGICKTSLGYSMPEPLLLDFDRGAHRAINRRATGVIETWADVETLNQHLSPYKSLVIDTVGRCIDLMSVDIIQKDAKMGRGGGELSIQGYGRLKSRFRGWMTEVRAHGLDVLLLAHNKEEKDGDEVTVRADITGGSYSEILKVADFVGYLHMVGKQRVLDFNPTAKWVGKNPAQWPPFEVPPPEKATEFMAKLYAMGRQALGQISETSAVIARQVDEWRQRIAIMRTAEDFTLAIPHTQAITPVLVQAQVKKLLADAAAAAGCTFDRATKKFVGPAKPEPPKASEPAPEPVGAAAGGGVDPSLGF